MSSAGVGVPPTFSPVGVPLSTGICTWWGWGATQPQSHLWLRLLSYSFSSVVTCFIIWLRNKSIPFLVFYNPLFQSQGVQETLEKCGTCGGCWKCPFQVFHQPVRPSPGCQELTYALFPEVLMTICCGGQKVSPLPPSRTNSGRNLCSESRGGDLKPLPALDIFAFSWSIPPINLLHHNPHLSLCL